MSSEVVDLHNCICYSYQWILSQSLFVPVYAARHGCVAVVCGATADPVFRQCWPVFTCLLPYDEKSRDCRCVQTGVQVLDTFQGWHCWIKIDSAMNFGETPSSEFAQCVLWVIRLTKTVESICCAVHYTVTLPRVVWRMIRWAHSVRVMIATTTDTGRPPPVLRRQQSIPSVSSTT